MSEDAVIGRIEITRLLTDQPGEDGDMLRVQVEGFDLITTLGALELAKHTALTTPEIFEGEQ
jgi:hypothetical protein